MSLLKNIFYIIIMIIFTIYNANLIDCSCKECCRFNKCEYSKKGNTISKEEIKFININQHFQSDNLNENIENKKNKNYIFLKPTLKWFNNNCTFNSIITSLFNSIYFQDFISSYNEDNEFFLKLKYLFNKMKNNNKLSIVDYETLYYSFLRNFLIEKRIINNEDPDNKKKLKDAIGIANILNFIYENTQFIRCYCMDIINESIVYSIITSKENNEIKNYNTNLLKKESIENIKNIPINKFIFEDLGIYNKYCSTIENIIKIENINVIEEKDNNSTYFYHKSKINYIKPNNFIYISEKEKNENYIDFFYYYIIICKDKRTANYLKKIDNDIKKNKNINNICEGYYKLKEILENKNIDKKLIAVNFNDLEGNYHTFPVIKNKKNNKRYIQDGLHGKHCTEFDFSTSLDNNLSINIEEHTYLPTHFYIEVSLKST